MSRSDRTDDIGTSNAKAQDKAEQASPATETVKPSYISFSEANGVAVAAILHLLRLVSAELVLLRGLDVQRFENAARKKLGEFTSPTTN
jgi:hypothetical protein